MGRRNKKREKVAGKEQKKKELPRGIEPRSQDSSYVLPITPRERSMTDARHIQYHAKHGRAHVYGCCAPIFGKMPRPPFFAPSTPSDAPPLPAVVRSMARRVLLAGTAYFGAAFGAGFVLGAVRTIVLVGAAGVGRTSAVAAELPLMLCWCWLAARRCVRLLGDGGRSAPPPAGALLCMGCIAFGQLMLAETGLAVGALGLSARQYAADMVTTTHGVLGLAGQVAFALMPWAQGLLGRRRRRRRSKQG